MLWTDGAGHITLTAKVFIDWDENKKAVIKNNQYQWLNEIWQDAWMWRQKVWTCPKAPIMMCAELKLTLAGNETRGIIQTSWTC